MVIFASYSDALNRVISSNEGFGRRVTKFFHVDDFDPKDLAEMFHLKMRNQTKNHPYDATDEEECAGMSYSGNVMLLYNTNTSNFRLGIRCTDSPATLYGFKLHPSRSVEAIADLIESETTQEQCKEMNGGFITPMLVNARENLDMRLDADCTVEEELLTLTMDDLRDGLQLLSRQEKGHGHDKKKGNLESF